MVVVLGKISPLLDLATPPHRIPDRRHRPLPSDVVLKLFKKESHHPNLQHAFESFFDSKERIVSKKKSNQSKVNGVEYDISSDDENGNGFEYDLGGGEDDNFDWEKEMRMRVNEIQEMRELEKKAEELQYKVNEEYGAGDANEDRRTETDES